MCAIASCSFAMWVLLAAGAAGTAGAAEAAGAACESAEAAGASAEAARLRLWGLGGDPFFLAGIASLLGWNSIFLLSHTMATSAPSSSSPFHYFIVLVTVDPSTDYHCPLLVL